MTVFRYLFFIYKIVCSFFLQVSASNQLERDQKSHLDFHQDWTLRRSCPQLRAQNGHLQRKRRIARTQKGVVWNDSKLVAWNHSRGPAIVFFLSSICLCYIMPITCTLYFSAFAVLRFAVLRCHCAWEAEPEQLVGKALHRRHQRLDEKRRRWLLGTAS